MDDLISRLSELRCQYNCFDDNERDAYHTLSEAIKALSDVPDTNVGDLISRQAAIDAVHYEWDLCLNFDGSGTEIANDTEKALCDVPSAQPERYTKEELRVFQHGISLSLLSKRSAQHWQYDEDTATEIKFLERLYDKVSADMKGGQG